ncbi:MAG: glycosyltransferase family 2 protein [Acidobacteria bacterium]|nr:glycosyltransferase family 2 protein [Acidobacteriota bacterium]
MTALVSTFLLFASRPALWKVVRQFVFDRSFEKVYRPNAFDVALLTPYFLVLIVLSAYGLHRYWLVFKYFRNKRHAARPPLERFQQLPRVTVQLPVYNERFVVERLVEAACRIEYPRHLLDIQVLDDSTDETVAVARGVVERYAALGHPVSYHHRDNRQGFKAGALAAGLEQARGEFIAIFDADFVPPPDFLHRTIHYFTDPGVGMVQGRWTFLNRNYSFLTQVQAILLDGHFVLEHGARYRSGCFFNFNGTAGVWRRRAIEEAGGWQHDTLTEDTDLSYRAQLRGWRFIYVPEIECPSELPVEMTAFKVQQARWAKGLIQTAKKLMWRIWTAPVPLHRKIEAWFHLTANLSYPLMIVLSALLLPAMIVRFYQGWFQMLYIDLPLFLAAFLSVSSFYLTSQRELYPNNWKRTFCFLPFLMAMGIGLTITNARAVLEALLGIKSPFVRTAKYRIETGGRRVRASQYRRRAGWIPFIEIVIGTYFAATVYYAIDNRNFATVPFLLLFVLGYYYTGFLSLLQEHMEALSRPVQAFRLLFSAPRYSPK